MLGDSVIRWRRSNPIIGPQQSGWTMIAHVYLGPPEFINVSFCPFCANKLVNIE
jgi:hypothetical protein